MSTNVDLKIANMNEEIALPRKNGELVFESPWQARAFGLAVALNEGGSYPWQEFSQALAGEITTAESTSEPSTYYERWLATLEKLVIEGGLLTREELEQMAIVQAEHEAHEHKHDHSHDHHGYHH